MNKSLLFIILSLFLASSLQATYDQSTAYELARASFASYCKKNLVNMNCGANCDALAGYKYVTQGDYIVGASADEALSFTSFVNVERKRFIVAFRGTNGRIQLLNEIKSSASTPFNLCKNVKYAQVMTYFYSGYRGNMRTNLLNHVKEMATKYPDFEFYFTGHSLGGALANLAALDLSCNGILKKAQIHLWTYGSPRVGDFIFASAVVNSVGEVWRITHYQDPVVHVPMCKTDLFGDCTRQSQGLMDVLFESVNYAWHIWPEVHYSKDFRTIRICTLQEDTACAGKYMLYDANTDDHSNYLGAINRCS